MHGIKEKSCDRLEITKKASEEKSSVTPHSFFAIYVSPCFRILFTVFVSIRVHSTTNSNNLTGISVKLLPVRQHPIQTSYSAVSVFYSASILLSTFHTLMLTNTSS